MLFKMAIYCLKLLQRLQRYIDYKMLANFLYIPFYEKALEIYQKTLPANHPHLAISYNNIGAVYYNMGEDSKALSYVEHALGILQRSLPPNHPHIQSVRNSIEIMKNKFK